jgi:hypothetical protein
MGRHARGSQVPAIKAWSGGGSRHGKGWFQVSQGSRQGPDPLDPGREISSPALKPGLGCPGQTLPWLPGPAADQLEDDKAVTLESRILTPVPCYRFRVGFGEQRILNPLFRRIDSPM